MMKKLLFAQCLALLLVLLASGARAEVKLPDAPKGFSWKRVDSVGCAVLVPKGWTCRVVENPASYDILITPKRVRGVEGFETGLRITAINAVDRRSHMTAWDYAQSVIDGFEKREKIEQRWGGDNGEIKTMGVLFSEKMPEGERTVHVHVMVNLRTQAVYVTIMVGLTAQWEDMMQKGGVALANFVFNPDF